jgi:hypothetical protein
VDEVNSYISFGWIVGGKWLGVRKGLQGVEKGRLG